MTAAIRHRLPGLVDVHVHLRNPGGEHKESVSTGTAAALAGGVTAVLAMPNTTPPITDAATLAAARDHHAAHARCDVGLYVGATPDNARQAAAIAGTACGLKVYVDETYGPLRIATLGPLAAHFAAWPAHRPIVLHAEEINVAAAIGLGSVYGRRVHIAHVSRAAEITVIKDAKAAGRDVTCEVAPHHLFLTDADARHLGPAGTVRPPLATSADRDALWRNLDAVDCVATDHAPHTRAEKAEPQPPPGMPGLETLLPLMLTAVWEGRLSLERLVELTSTRPAEIFGVPTPAQSAVEVEIGPRRELPADGWETRAGWSPFSGMSVRGRVLRTELRGQTAFEDGAVLAQPGQGRMLFDPVSPRARGGSA